MMSGTDADALLARVWSELGGDGATPRMATPVPLASQSATGALAWASVAAASLAANALAPIAPAGDEASTPGLSTPVAHLDPVRIAVAYTSERHLRINDRAVDVWSPLSGFFSASDGWVRTHGNYPHHAAAIRRALGLREDAGKDELRRALSSRSMREASEAITAEGGLCVPVSQEDPVLDEALRGTPLIRTALLGEAAPRVHAASADAPLRGIRVLDLTRVIAGPVATRTLALFGADVLRIDPPALPEPELQLLDTGHGKRFIQLDIRRSPATLDALLQEADVLVTGYRPSAIDALGLSPDAVAQKYPGIVVARLSAWGFGAGDADRRGFDSLVQAATGIAMLESVDGQTPGVLPAQALDHSAGYLLAAAIMTLLRRQSREGGTWLAETSLRRIAAELLGMTRTAQPEPVETFDLLPHMQRFDIDGRSVMTAGPALPVHGRWIDFQAPRPGAIARPEWLPR